MSFTTSKTLLEKIAANDEISWQEFYTTYSPLIRLRGGDLHLDLLERAELVQDVMLAIFKSRKSFHYQPERGKFRNYLKTITTNCAFHILKKRLDHPAGPLPEELEETSFDEHWQREWETYLLEECLKLLREKMEPLSYQAFYFYALLGTSPQKTAKALKISLNCVYLAKSRGIAILKENLIRLRKED